MRARGREIFCRPAAIPQGMSKSRFAGPRYAAPGHDPERDYPVFRAVTFMVHHGQTSAASL
jgi:hypothetical protein